MSLLLDVFEVALYRGYTDRGLPRIRYLIREQVVKVRAFTARKVFIRELSGLVRLVYLL